MWIATLETSHFSFEAFDSHRGKVLAAMTKGLREHAEQTGLARSWVAEVMEDVKYREVFPGQCWRDKDLVLAQAAPITATLPITGRNDD